ncbi:MAG: glycosyltransferase [Acidimicrobiia bacterium]
MRVVCITGMHRSGASLLARIVSLLGVDLGPQGEFLEAAPDNRHGFFDQRSIKDINDGVLKELGGSWHQPPTFPPGWEWRPELDFHREQARRKVARLFEERELVGWTDPRTSLLLSFWRTVVPIERTLLILREPRRVVNSVVARDGLDPVLAARLWLRYVVSAWLNDPGHLLVHYEQLLDGPEPVVRSIASFLGIAEPDSQRLKAIAEIVEPGASHHPPAASITDQEALRLAESIHHLLQESPRQVLEPVFERLADTWTLESSEESRRALAQAEEQLAAVDAKRERYEAQLAEATEALAAAEAQGRRRQAELGFAEERLAFLEAQSRRHQSHLDGERAKLVRVRGQLEEVRRRYERLRNRRAVKVALGLASLARPLFRAGRQPSPAAEERPTLPAPTRPVPAARRTPIPDETLDSLRNLPPVTVIIPVHNALEDLRSCLDAVARNTTASAEILVIDDASTDPRMGPFLEQVAAMNGVRVLHNSENLGFVRTVNRGFAESSGDVIILNSDAEVTPRWVENLRVAAYQDPLIGTVTPLSDNAGAFSAPDIGVENQRPPAVSKDDLARLVTQASGRLYPSTPTGNGYCMYIKRAVLDAVGWFDAESFPRGYGEENDFCMRAGKAGWRHVVDDATFIFHRRAASFGAERQALLEAARRKVDELHPEYTALVGEFIRSGSMAEARRNVQKAFEEAERLDGAVRTRILYVVHEGAGGTPETNADLMEAMADCYEPYLLTSDTQNLRLSAVHGRELQALEVCKLDERLQLSEVERADYREFVSHVLSSYAIELVHVRHLFKHSLELPSVAAALGVPTVLSFHDYYFVCPTVHLLDESNRFCGGVCTPGDGTCRVPGLVGDLPHLKHTWVYTWRDRARAMFENVSAFVTTSQSAQEIYLRSFPELEGATFQVIEHGRDLPQRSELAQPPDPLEPVRILVPGNVSIPKGAEFVRKLKELDRADRLRFSFLGPRVIDLSDTGTHLGPYRRDEFADKVAEVRPHFIGLFSIWAETYSHTLTEAWAAGIPVIASSLGALGERVGTHGGGWLVDVTDPEGAYQRILQIADDPEEYLRVAEQAAHIEHRTTNQMAQDYDHVYRSVLAARQSVQDDRRWSPHRRRLLDLGMFLPGKKGQRPASTYVRTLTRMTHPQIVRKVAASSLELERFLDGGAVPEVAYVQRTGVPPCSVGAFIERTQACGVPILVDLDDNLLELPEGGTSARSYGYRGESLKQLLGAARLLTVSTEALREAYSPYARDVVVIPNALDERVWFGLDIAAPPADRGRSINLLYMGTNTHSEDLALFRPVLDSLRVDHGLDVRLFVIGGEPQGPDQEWYRRVHVPLGSSTYPRFVRWLRSQRPAWDIAVAPLRDTTFNRCKSDLKFLEYSALGLPGVYSAVGPYAQSVRDGDTGFLAPNDPDLWAKQILSLVTDPELREAIASRAHAYVRDERVLGLQAMSFLEILFSVLR